MPVFTNGDETGVDGRGSSSYKGNEGRLLRYVQGVLGESEMTLECRPRFDFGRSAHTVELTDSGVIFKSETGERLSLSIPCEFVIRNGGVFAEFTLRPAEAITFALEWMPPGKKKPESFTAEQGEELFRETVTFWRNWVARCTYQGRWREDLQPNWRHHCSAHHIASGRDRRRTELGLPLLLDP
jgi:GH15 family glucan-1,4-alpha-glucosidase